MRTTVTLDPDTAAVVDTWRHEHGTGVSAAINELIRRAATSRPTERAFVQRTSPGHALIDVTNTADTLELLYGPHAR